MSSDIDIANLALLKLGTDPIASFNDGTTESTLVQDVYAILRDDLQRKFVWSFCKQMAVLATSTTSTTTGGVTTTTNAPLFQYSYEYPLPADCLRILIAGSQAPATNAGLIYAGVIPPGNGQYSPGLNLGDYDNAETQDYEVFGRSIWSNLGPPLTLKYLRRVTDPTQFDSSFVPAFAAYLAWNISDRLTGPQRKPGLLQEYKEAMSYARMANAIELPSTSIADDTWMMSRLGS